MAERRAIKSDIWGDEFFGGLPYIAMVLWIGLFSKCADDQGRISENLSLIKSNVFPYKDIPLYQIEECLCSFDGHILRYKNSDRKYIQLVRWWDNQPLQYAVPSNYPPPDGWLDRYRTNYKKHYICFNWPGLDNSPDGILLHNILVTLGRVSSWHDYLGVLNPNPIFNPNPNSEIHAPEGAMEEAVGRTDAVKNGDAVDMLIMGSSKKNDPILEYPIDIQDTLREFINYFPLDIPGKKDKSGYGYWCKDLLELKKCCGDYGLSIIQELHNDWITKKYSVSHPGALCNTAKSKVMEKRSMDKPTYYKPPIGRP
jgi:hypothetical protein